MHLPNLPDSSTGTRKRNVVKAAHWHPYRMVLWLLICSISMLFLVLLIAFITSHLYQVREKAVPLPIAFLFSTMLMGFSSYALHRGRQAFRKEKYQKLTYWLCVTAVLTLCFLITQVTGWLELQRLDVYLSSHSSGSYLYVLSGLHFLHLLGGLGFLGLIIAKTYTASIDGIQALLFSTDPFRKLQLQLLSTYWNFMGALWLVLYLTFAVML